LGICDRIYLLNFKKEHDKCSPQKQLVVAVNEKGKG
jgi:hypothetical protein